MHCNNPLFYSKINYVIIEYKKSEINKVIMKKYLLNIKIINNKVTLFISGSNKKTEVGFKELEWNDQRDLSEKLLGNIDSLLRKNNLAISDISKINFSSKKCGFMTEQIGKITVNVLNFKI